MNKKLLVSTIIACLCIGFISNTSYACPIIDTKNMSKVFKSIFQVHQNQSTANETATKDEQLQEDQTGNAGCSASPGNKQTEIKTTAWDFIAKGKFVTKKTETDDKGVEKEKKTETSVLQTITTSKFLPASNATDISEAKEDLINTMYFKDETAYKNASSAKKEALRTKRKQYANEVASKGYALATALRPKLQEDAKSLISVQTTGCNQTQSHALQNRNLKALIKTTAANIVIQILAMENEAAIQLQNEELVEIPEEKIIKDLKGGDSK